MFLKKDLSMTESSIEYRLLAVKEIPEGTAINRRSARRFAGKPISLDLAVRLVPEVEKSMVSLVVTCSYIYKGVLRRERLLTCSALATFEVPELKKHIERNGENVVVDSPLLMAMLGVAVGALRGIVAVRTAGTALSGSPLPIVDLTALMYRLRYGR